MCERHGYMGSVNRIQTLMRAMGLRARAPDQVWPFNSTYRWTREGWPYVCVCAVLDLFTRRIVGWAMASHMTRELVLDALRMAQAVQPSARPPTMNQRRPVV